MPSVLSEDRMKVDIKSIGFCRISISRTGVMEDCRGDQVILSDALYVTIGLLLLAKVETNLASWSDLALLSLGCNRVSDSSILTLLL